MSYLEQAAKAVADITAKLAAHQDVLDGIEARRAEVAFGAATGDASAAAALEAIARDEREANEPLRNLDLALREAQSQEGLARRRMQADARKAAQQELAKALQDLQTRSAEVDAALGVLAACLRRRDEIVAVICGHVCELSPPTRNRFPTSGLGALDHILARINLVLGKYLGNFQFSSSTPTIGEVDRARFGRLADLTRGRAAAA